ncbi:MAG: TIGR01620 family protein [Xanthobacteraceae bacterium]
MSDTRHAHALLEPRVFEVDAPERLQVAALQPLGPLVLETDESRRVTPSAPALLAAVTPVVPQRRDRVLSLGFTGVVLFLAGWLTVDAIEWVTGAFARGPSLGVLALVAVTAGVTGAALVVGRELRSLFRLKSVEELHRKFADDSLRAGEARAALARALAVIPRERATASAIQTYQRQAQLHHSTAQQIELFSRTVLQPLDRRAEAHVRNAVVRAFGITAISPTALTDAAFFLACGLRMVRMVAASYGHRPTAASTIHLLRRLVLEAGKLGAVDIASASILQHLGGAVAERLATTTAESLYAAYRMARLGIIVMDLCRPVPFRGDEFPSVTSLVSNVIKRKSDAPPM